MSIRGMRALALAFLLVGAAFTAFGTNVAASPSDNQPEPSVIGPRLDEVVVSEQLDRSLALTQMIAGQQDSMWFDVSGAVDQDRARAADTLDKFPAYGLMDYFDMNPVVQAAGFPDNPFAIRAVREAMHYLIDKDFIVRDIYGGTAVPFKTLWHPRSPDYGRGIADLFQFEDKYAFSPEKGKTQMFTALQAAGWAIGTDGFWHDPSGDLAIIKGAKRIQDQRFQMGGYYEALLTGLNFKTAGFGVPGAAIAHANPPDQNLWHYYTAGWIQTSLAAWDDDRLHFYHACGFPRPICGAGFYAPPAELLDIAERLLGAQYDTLAERAQMVVRGTELAMQEAVNIPIDARQSIWVNNVRADGIIWDLFGGNSNPWSLKAATVPAVGGVRQLKQLNLIMFVDGWNCHTAAWLYDAVQRDLMIDPGMAYHPHTGRLVNYRNNATVETVGATGTPLSVPSGAVLFDGATNTWLPVAAGTTAISKVTYDMMLGSWHHGPAITMDDVMYEWAMLIRRADEANGDIATTPGINNAATGGEKFFVTDILKAIRVVDADTIEVFMDYFHPDVQQIAGTGSAFPCGPWELGELGARLVLDQNAVYKDADLATAPGAYWLDFTKGDSLPDLAAALTTYRTANERPPGMATYPGGEITAAEATARWTALADWVLARGHYWPSNGPFYLASLDVTNRQSVFRAFRTGYPVPQNYWDALTIVGIANVNFAPTPPVVFAGTPARFDFSVSVGPAPTDAFDSTWFLRDVSTGEFLVTDQPTRLGAGSYRIEIPGASATAVDTDELLLGNFEIITVVTSHTAAVPTISRSPFLILPSTAWFEALLDARATLLEGDITDLSGDIGTVQSDLRALSASTSGLLGLVTAMAILAVVAVVVAVVSVVLVMRRGRAPPMMKSESGGEGSGQM